MEAMEDKLGAILNNPGMMQQIMAIAQSLSGSSDTPPAPPTPEPVSMPDIDPALLQNIIGLAGKSQIDNHQKALLHALRPYLSELRIHKLEKAMRAAKLANLASGFLGSGLLSRLTGR